MSNISKNKIRKVGRSIRNELDEPSNENLLALQEYRKSFKDTLSEIFTALTIESKKISTESISSYRIKRIDTIIRKLHRFNGMELDRMWDIAGCRFIMTNLKQVKKFEKKIKNRYYVLNNSTRDYYTKPTKSGYKSLHLYIRKSKNDFYTIEIQIRTFEDHNWATFVEIIDFLYEDDSKEANDIRKTQFGEFHKLLSKKRYLNHNEKSRIIDIVTKNKIYEQLNNIFIKNYIEVRRQWETEIYSKRKKYFVIESRRDNFPIFNSYDNYEEAETEYFNRFIKRSNSNVLLTHLSNVNFSQINKAYSNYMLTMHSFIDDFIKLLQDMITYSIEKKRIFIFKKYYSEYVKTLKRLEGQLSVESNEISKLQLNKKNLKQLKIWKQDLMNRYNKIQTKQKRFLKEVARVYPREGFFPFFLKIVGKRVERKLIMNNKKSSNDKH